ncbi:hypothetical protein DV738_g4434, partial [Chaetothyriales sp. CBS 135597]
MNTDTAEQRLEGFRVWRAPLEQLEEASRHGDLSAVKQILEANWPGGAVPFDQASRQSLRYSVLQAIDHDHHHVVAYLLSHRLSFEREYALRAVQKKSYELMEILLTHGWDINDPLGPSIPPALCMVLNDRQMIEWFLSHGADVNAPCKLGITPLTIAVEVASLDVLHLLFDYGGSVKYGELLHVAASYRRDPDCTAVLQLLLDHGAEINHLKYRDNYYCFLRWEVSGVGTPLDDAAASGNEVAVRYLLDQGANPRIRNTCGHLPSEVARRNRHITTAQLLESAMATFGF